MIHLGFRIIPIKTITSVLKTSTTLSLVSQLILSDILMIMSVLAFKTAVILHFLNAIGNLSMKI